MRSIWERLVIWAALVALVGVIAPATSAAWQPAPPPPQAKKQPTHPPPPPAKKQPPPPPAATKPVPPPPTTKAPSSSPTPAPTPAPASQPYTLGTFNMAGGNPDYGDQPSTALTLSASIKANNADIVFLQETCKDMTDLLAATLGSGWTVKFLDTTKTPCKGSGASTFGIGIVVRTSIGTPPGGQSYPLPIHGYPLPSGNFEQRWMLCLDTATPPIFACSTHLTDKEGDARDKVRRQQTERITKIVSTKTKAGEAVFIGGDFNTTPETPALNPLWDRRYGGGAFGSFLEVDSGPSQQRTGYQRRAGGGTFPGFLSSPKFDYIFVRDVTVRGASIAGSDSSDHDQLWAIVDD